MNKKPRARFFYSLLFLSLGMAVNTWPFSLGIENISPDIVDLLRGDATHPRTIALVTNQTGCDQQGNRTVDVLLEKGVRVTHILAPEHGFDGTCPAGKLVEDTIDAKTGIPVVSAYGRGGDYSVKGKQIDIAVMKKIDVLCYDLQDVGMRHYTYISTLLCAIEAAAEHAKPFIVFDRPNLLGPYMEGPVVDTDPALRSFISLVPIPLRHGMTIGELATYFNTHFMKKAADLHVVKMCDYKRNEQPLFFKTLSPNLKTIAACHGYSFLGILGEVQPFEVGAGTLFSFQTIMLPDTVRVPAYVWERLRVLLEKYKIRATHHSATKKNQQYSGLRLHFANIMKTASFSLLLDILSFFQKAGIALNFSNLFDKAIGTSLVRKVYVEKGAYQPLYEYTKNGLAQFMKQARDCFLYEPLPTMVLPVQF